MSAKNWKGAGNKMGDFIEKLQVVRTIEGFPNATDEAIEKRSDAK